MFPISQSNPKGFYSFSKIIEEETKKHVTKKVNQYFLFKKLGYGSTSKVYLSQNCITKSLYAAKMIRLSDTCHTGNGAAGLDREIRIMRSLRHPSIIKLHEVLYDSHDSTAYLFIEYANSGTLDNLISSKVHLSDETLASAFKQITEGLIYLHSQGIVHHDVKPSNIMLFSKGQAKLADFGIGHSVQSKDQVIGTPAYQAPEIFNDDEDDPFKEDVWSLGISLYEAAFGKVPYNGFNVYEIIHNIQTNPLEIPENHNRSPFLIDIIKKMLTVNYKERISMKEVIEHPFLSNAKESFKINDSAILLPKIDSENDVKYISATVCDKNFTFVKDSKYFSWPGSVSLNIEKMIANY